MYEKLDSQHIIRTAEAIHSRIDVHFPNSGLEKLSREFIPVAVRSAALAEDISKPDRVGRVVAVLGASVLVVALVSIVHKLNLTPHIDRFSEFLQALESGINDAILLGAGVFFLFTVGTRRKRARALKALHELRSLAHIIDMHQLTKDPKQLVSAKHDRAEERAMSQAELGRYLDYCSEMLSLISKVAALFVQHFSDPVVLSAVDELEALVNGLSSKMWQKIMILHIGNG